MIFVLLLVLVGIGFMFLKEKDRGIESKIPVYDKTGFSTNITNPYFSLPTLRTLVYEGQTDEGLERVEISIEGETKVVDGVTTLVYRDKVYVAGVMVEDTWDYLAQDAIGNVWYFGENVNNYEEGVIVDHDGSWLAGENGAEAGIWMKANPKVGDTYKQEYLKGEAEDMADVVSISEKLTIRGKQYENCLKTYDYTPLDINSKEYKYYCKETGSLVLEENILTGEKVELVSVTDK